MNTTQTAVDALIALGWKVGPNATFCGDVSRPLVARRVRRFGVEGAVAHIHANLTMMRNLSAKLAAKAVQS